MSLLLSIFDAKTWGIIATLAAGAMVFVWRIFAAGENRQIAKQQKDKLETIKDKKAKDDEINRLSPADLGKRFNRWMRDK